ncbi:unnamed protein product, partial [marine sediment metagenome]
MDLSNFYAKKNHRLYLLIPAVLFILFLFLIFVWPTVPKGIDLQGGTLISIRSEKPIDAAEMQQLLSENFALLDLKVNSISGPSGNGVNIQYAGNETLLLAKSQLEQAKSQLASNPQAALESAKLVTNTLSPFIGISVLPPEPEKAVAMAEFYFVEANQNINQEMQQLIVSHFSLGDDVAFQKKEVSP